MNNDQQLQSRISTLLSNFNQGGKLIFSEPVQQGNVTIITVSKVRFGFGFGFGTKQHEQKEGVGGGGALFAVPIGYIEMLDDRTRFKAIRKISFNLLVLMLGITAITTLRFIKTLK